MKLHYITYNGTTSKSLGIYVSRGSTFDAAAPDYVSYQIPGKNGDLQINNDRWLNIDVSYPVFIPGGFEASVQAVRNWMRSANGYAQLTDTYDTTHYREGRGKDILEFEPTAQNNGANFTLVFDCKPQRFITSAYDQVTVTTGAVLTNPTQFNALPRFEVNGVTNGATLTVANSLGTVTMTATRNRSGSAYIDCETCNIYALPNNLNDLFTGDFPVFAPGSNTITFSGFTYVKVRPRYWEL